MQCLKNGRCIWKAVFENSEIIVYCPTISLTMGNAVIGCSVTENVLS